MVTTNTIPVIDFGPYFAGEPDSLERAATSLRHACENFGVFYALNHHVPQCVIKRAFAASRRFHALPLAEKLKLKLNENRIGYLPMDSSLQSAGNQASRQSHNESFFISNDRRADHPDVVAGTTLCGRNQWPARRPGMRRDMLAYFHALSAMCNRMLPVFAVALDMSADFFSPYFAGEAHAKVRFLHYPPQPADSDLTGLGAHADLSFMAALARTDVPGLSIRLPSGEWFAPTIIPGTFLINVGQTLQRWTNDRFKAVTHGVLNDSGRDRYSITCFYSPNLNQVIECLPSCVSADNPARYTSFLHSDFWRERYGLS